MIDKIYKLFKKYQNYKAVIRFHGCYQTWEEAEDKVGCGYNAEAIFDKVSQAALDVLEGKAKFERDGVLFYHDEVHPILANCALRAAIENKGRVGIIDFGGGPASSYFQNKHIFEEYIDEFEYVIVEQNKLVEFGNQRLRDEHLHFVAELSEIEEIKQWDVAFISASIQYIKSDRELMGKLRKIGMKYVIMERIPISNIEFYCIETVHEPIYEAEYPMRVYEETRLLYEFEKDGYICRYRIKSDISSEVWFGNRKVVFMTYVFISRNKQGNRKQKNE